MSAPARRLGGNRFAVALTIIAASGFAIRLAYVLLVRADVDPGGDAFFYHEAANLLVDGKGFIVPFHYLASGLSVEAADHPPLYLLFLAVPSVVGLDTPLAHMVWSSALGAGTVVVSGLLGRKVAGARTGLIAAALVAVYPNVWLHDGALLSETIAIFVATLAVLLTYWARERPTAARLALLGAVCGAAALARSELVLLVPALLIPVAWRAPAPGQARLALLGIGVLASAVVVAPWVAYNLSRFDEPVLLSTQLEPTLAGANCRDTYDGPALGFLTPTCLRGLDNTEDQSVNGRILRDRTERFVRNHLDRVPVVTSARLGRVLGVYRADEQVSLYEFEGRERWVGILGTVTYYLVAAGAIAGAVVLRRQRTAALYPLLTLPAIAVVTVIITYGTNRFRAVAETSLAVLAAIALDALWRVLHRRWSRSHAVHR